MSRGELYRFADDPDLIASHPRPPDGSSPTASPRASARAEALAAPSLQARDLHDPRAVGDLADHRGARVALAEQRDAASASLGRDDAAEAAARG